MAAATTPDLSKIDGAQYAVSWKGVSIGWTKDVDPSGLKPKAYERKIGELNNIVIDRIRKGGLEGAVKTTLHEVNADRLREMMPWAAATGGFALNPSAEYYSEYANSGILLLHPRTLPTATVTDDITILHAFPTVMLPKNAGDDDREVEIEWNILPDQAALIASPPTIVYGYIGATPA